MNDSALFPALLRRIRPAVLLPLVGGNLLIFLVAVLALLIPDSHAWQLVLSSFLALSLAIALLVWNSIALRRFRVQHANAPILPLWQSALLLAGWLFLAALLFHMMTFALPNVEMRAGFWNSRLSPGLRHLFPYQRLIWLQNTFLNAMMWVMLPALLVPFAMEAVVFGLHPQPLYRAVCVLRTARYWLIAIASLGLVAWLTPVLVDWHPTDTVHGEVVSAALRLTLIALLDASAILLVLAMGAELLHRTATQFGQASDVYKV